MEAQVEALASELRRRRERNEALAERTREQTLRLLHTFSPDEVDGFVAGLMTQIRNWSQYERIEALLHEPERLVRDVVDALRLNPRSTYGRPQVTFNLQARIVAACFSDRQDLTRHGQVNGDVQRGKSKIEAFQALVVKYINDSQSCRDKCFTVLGTQMVPWAVDVANKMERAAMGPSAALEEDDPDFEPDVAELVDASSALFLVTHIKGAGGRAGREAHAKLVERTMKEGGCIVFSRTHLKIDPLTDAMFAYTESQRGHGLTVSAHFVILDEADRMRGTGVEGSNEFAYERALSELTGGSRVLSHSRANVALPDGDPPERRYARACLVSDVSATNGLSFFAMLHRLGTPGHKLLDVISFKDDPEYVGFERCDRHNDKVLDGLSQNNVFVNDDVVDLYQEVLSTDHACLLDCTTTRVNAGTPGNQQEHAERVVESLRQRPQGATLLAARGMAFVFVHGGARTFAGNVGLSFVGAGAAARVTELSRRAAAATAAAGFEAIKLPGCMGDYVTQAMLRPLLADLDVALSAAGEKPLMRDRLTLEQLPLTLLLLRTVWPDLPVVVVGHGMVRRSLSVVAVDAAGSCVLAVTHEVQWASPAANAADVTQQFLRASTTLSSFHRTRGFPRVRVLAPAHVWVTVSGAVLFNKWFASRFGAGGAPLGRAEAVAPFERVEAALARGMERSAAVFRFLDMPVGVRNYFNHRNPFHPRARELRALSCALAGRYAADAAGEAQVEEEDAAAEEEGEADGEAGEEALAEYRRRGPAIRRAHKAEAMAQLRQWLCTPRVVLLSPVDLASVAERHEARYVEGLPSWRLIEDVLLHQPRDAVWERHGVWTCRTGAGALGVSGTRPGAGPWAPRAGAAAPGPAPPGAFDAHADLVALLAAHSLAALAPSLQRVLGIWRREHLLSLREDGVRQLHEALRGKGGLSADRRQALMDCARAAATTAACSVCAQLKSLCVNQPCGHTVACAGCTREHRAPPPGGHGAVCVSCGAPSEVVTPPEVDCLVCGDAFTPAEMFTFACPSRHQLCIADAVGQLRRAVMDRHAKLPLQCECCRADLAGNEAAQLALPPLAASTLAPLLRLSRCLLSNPGCPPLLVDEFKEFEMHHAFSQGLLARCPAPGCARTTVLEAGAGAEVVCATCARRFCRACDVPWHDGLTCEQSALQRQSEQRGADLATAALLRLAARCPTPNCRAPANIHDRGHHCHHTRCLRCNAHFCNVCSAPWQGGCTGGCSTYCDNRCTCPDCPVCKPGRPCTLCSNDGTCRSCRPGRA